MNIDRILTGLNDHGVRYLLIGGMNYMLRHKPVLTYDVDVWIEDTPENRQRCEAALAALDAQWGSTDEDWGPVAHKSRGWLDQQSVYCLNSPHGAIDVFRSVLGLESWGGSFQNAVHEATSAGTSYSGLSDRDMLACQTALVEAAQKRDRIAALKEALGE
jgi:hypothetical protein